MTPDGCAAGGAEGLLGAKGFEAPKPLDWDESDGSSSSSYNAGGSAAPAGSSEQAGSSGEASTSGREYAEAERRFRGCAPSC